MEIDGLEQNLFIQNQLCHVTFYERNGTHSMSIVMNKCRVGGSMSLVRCEYMMKTIYHIAIDCISCEGSKRYLDMFR